MQYFRKLKSLLFLYEIDKTGRILRNCKSKKVLSQRINNQGYALVTVCIKGKPKHVTVHSLVAEAWLGDKPDGFEIDHIDKNKLNNEYTNLRYVTHSENNLNRSIHWKKPVKISSCDETLVFETSKECAMYLAEKYNKTFAAIRYKLSSKRSRIYDYDIFYLPYAETVRQRH